MVGGEEEVVAEAEEAETVEEEVRPEAYALRPLARTRLTTTAPHILGVPVPVPVLATATTGVTANVRTGAPRILGIPVPATVTTGATVIGTTHDRRAAEAGAADPGGDSSVIGDLQECAQLI